MENTKSDRNINIEVIQVDGAIDFTVFESVKVFVGRRMNMEYVVGNSNIICLALILFFFASLCGIRRLFHQVMPSSHAYIESIYMYIHSLPRFRSIDFFLPTVCAERSLIARGSEILFANRIASAIRF